MKIFFDKPLGAIKPMHATNNGPYAKLEAIEAGEFHPFTSNFKEFKAAGIPYARTHDSSFYHRYGQEHTVDVAYVFPNFDADPTDATNYDFTCTDAYLRCCELAGTEVFFRLGHRIEHEVKKYGTLPPKDFKKWAVICEHIIRHYTEGWANGYRMKITYWEIWNEPDLHWNRKDFVSPTWGGTREQFFELYHIAATHLKSCFPHLKIGGPALAGDTEWAEAFLAQLKAPLDFFSWHRYDCHVEGMLERITFFRSLLDKYGYKETESILNEWSYVRGWHGDDIVYSHDQRGGIKGAAFSLAAMAACQYTPVDMLMYYDARPNEFWCGLFDCRVIGRVLKGYYPFPMFHTLYRLGTCVRIDGLEENIYACAAKGAGEAAAVITHYCEEDGTAPKVVEIDLCAFGCAEGTEVELFLLDGDHNCESVGSATYYGERLTLTLTLPCFTSYLIKMKQK